MPQNRAEKTKPKNEDRYQNDQINDIDELQKHHKYFEIQKNDTINSVKDRLKMQIQYWKSINANEFVIYIDKENVILFIPTPQKSFSKNIKSALESFEFVTQFRIW